MSLKERMRAEGKALGFTRVGFAAPGERPESRLLREWLRLGHAGEMDHLHRRQSERSDPRVLAPWVKSLVVAALPYANSSPVPPGSARLSRYARGRDYHRVLGERLKTLGRVIEEAIPGGSVRPVVDTDAILEKPWAAAAGLGWQGKHTLLIHPDAGSWFFLGEILTDVEIEPDRPAVTNRCGTCTRCIDACPTAAFPEPYVLDSRRCISYLTIEHKSAVPEGLRSLVGEWVFGCDICQEVCPWNSRPDRGDPELEAAGDPPRMAEMMEMGREEFNRRFAGTPLRRAGWSRLLRNVAVALGNSGDSGAVPVLRKALAIPDPLIREHVSWALDRLLHSTDPATPRSGVEPVP